MHAEHAAPSRKNPALHVHVRPATSSSAGEGGFAHAALAWHPLFTHASMSAHAVPETWPAPVA